MPYAMEPASRVQVCVLGTVNRHLYVNSNSEFEQLLPFTIMLLRALVPKLPHRIALFNPLFQHVHFNRHLTKSSVQGPLEPPLSTKTLAQYFETEVLDKYHARPALICRKEAARAHGGPPTHNLGRVSSCLAWSFEEFDRHINALARGLLSVGVQPGDRVGVIMGNNRYVSFQPSV